MKFNSLKINLIILLFVAFLQNATAQTLASAYKDKNVIQRAELVGKPLASTESAYLFYQLLQIPTTITFTQYHTETDVDGNTHSRYQQYHEGILVEGGEYILHSKQGVIYAVNGRYQPLSNLVLNKKLNETEAIQAAVQAIGAKEYAWENATAEKFIKGLRKDHTATYFPNPTLSIIAEQTKDNTAYYLCYSMHIRATAPDLSLQVTIDANTGKLLHKVNAGCQADGRANTLYNGNNVPIRTSLIPNSGNEYELYDDFYNIRTLNAQGTTLPTGDAYTNVGNLWYAPKPEHDAHYGATKTVAYFQHTHQRASYDGNYGTELVQLANALTTDGKDNATWTQTERVIRYGNGDITFKPLTSLDIVAHEIGHAYSYGLRLGYAANNIFVSDENAEVWHLHEGFSDIWAMCVDRDDWTLAEQIMQNNYGCLRSIENPNIAGIASLAKGRDTYTTNYFNSLLSGSTHTKGLLLAHWFYVLSEGKVGVNEIGNSYTVQGIGKTNAEKIVYRMYHHLPYDAKWKDIAPVALAAAKELYGECSIQYATVHNALYAVNLLGVGGQTPNAIIPVPSVSYLSPATLLCHAEETTASVSYNWNNTPLAAIGYEWKLGNGYDGLQFVDANGVATSDIVSFSPAVRLRFTSNASNDFPERQYATLTANVYCYGATPTERRIVATRDFYIWLGRPNPIKILQPNFSSLCIGQIYGVQVQGGEGRTETIWTNESPTVLQKVSEEYNTAFYRVIDYGLAKISVTAKNRCVNSVASYFSANVWYNCQPDDLPCPPKTICALRFVLAPNPASSIVNLKNLNQQEHIETNFTFKVYNTTGSLLLSSEATNQAVLDVSQWSDGIYTVLIQTENGVQALKLAVQKGNVAN